MRRIEFLRRNIGMSQRAFGVYVGVDASYICNAEKNGVLYPNHRRRIAEKLDVEAETLLDEVIEVKEVC